MIITTFLYYGVKTFQANIEAVYFMRNITPDMAPGLFMMTAPLALLWPPVAVWLLGKARNAAGMPTTPSLLPAMSSRMWLGKLFLLGVLLYPLLFFAFGYYVAWQSPAVRAFYQGADPGSFLLQMRTIIVNDTHLIPNPLMPTIVRQVHFVETASSNFLFGVIAGVILLWRPLSGQAAGDFDQQQVTHAALPVRAL